MVSADDYFMFVGQCLYKISEDVVLSWGGRVGDVTSMNENIGRREILNL